MRSRNPLPRKPCLLSHRVWRQPALALSTLVCFVGSQCVVPLAATYAQGARRTSRSARPAATRPAAPRRNPALARKAPFRKKD